MSCSYILSRVVGFMSSKIFLYLYQVCFCSLPSHCFLPYISFVCFALVHVKAEYLCFQCNDTYFSKKTDWVNIFRHFYICNISILASPPFVYMHNLMALHAASTGENYVPQPRYFPFAFLESLFTYFCRIVFWVDLY